MSTVYASAVIDAAKVAGESEEMDKVAEKLATLARGFAAAHNDTGKFETSIRVVRARGKRGVSDRLVENTDPNGGNKEFGHMMIVRYKKTRRVRLIKVAGQHSMAKAIAAMPVVSGD